MIQQESLRLLFSYLGPKNSFKNNSMGKTRDLFKKIRELKGRFHGKTDTIKTRNDLELTETEDIKNRWQEYTEELYRKDFHDPNNHDDVITQLEPNILECKSSSP